MHVPRFPPPPTLDGADDLATADSAVTDDPDVTSSARPVSVLSSAPRDRNARARDVCGFYRRCRNDVHPWRGRATVLRMRMPERDDGDDGDLVCANGTATPHCLEFSSRLKDLPNDPHGEGETVSVQSVGVQTAPEIPYRLRVLPSLEDILENDDTGSPKKTSRFRRHLRFLGRLSLCQFGLAWLLTFWALAGAASFYATEGPGEYEEVDELEGEQLKLAQDLATELRQVKPEEAIWRDKTQKYFKKHRELLRDAVSSGYAEGDIDGKVWTFPGCILFAVSLLTTLGFGAPVPRTTAGRMVTVIFAAIGIPAHFLLILNIGILLAVRLRAFAIRRRTISGLGENVEFYAVPRWVKFVPFASIGGYYFFGILFFGVARSRPIAASLLFPLDFTKAGGLATTPGFVRILYAIYLEGAVTIAAVAVAILQVSATKGLTSLGLKYGLLTNT